MLQREGQGAAKRLFTTLDRKRVRNSLSRKMRRRVFQDSGGECGICGRKLALPEEVNLDHIWPVFYGGGNAPTNLRLICARCNLMKRRSPPNPVGPHTLMFPSFPVNGNSRERGGYSQGYVDAQTEKDRQPAQFATTAAYHRGYLDGTRNLRLRSAHPHPYPYPYR